MVAPKLYDDLLMDHIKNARNYYALHDASRTASGVNPLCGDEVTVYLKLDEDRLQEIAFQCTCCGISMASASIMTQSMRGKETGDALASIRAFADLLATPSDVGVTAGANEHAVLDAVRRFPTRIRCALLPWVTLEAALQGRAVATVSRQ
jgi:nitrogen fixation NifU-like protein